MTWANALSALATSADAAGMKPCDKKPPRRADRATRRERIFGAWADVQDALYKATGTTSVTEAGRRLRFAGMSLRVSDVIVAMRDLRDQLSNPEELQNTDAEVYEQLATRAVMAIRQASEP
jgi:hypothetical protein